MLGMRKVVLVGAMGVAALGLVGVGTGASFTDSVSVTQKVTAGHINMQVTGPAGSTVNGKTVSLADTAPLGSTFKTGPQNVAIINAGNISVTAWQLSFDYVVNGDATASAALAGQMYAKVTSNDPTQGAQVLFDGKVSDLKGRQLAVTGPLAPGASDNVAVEFYAGEYGVAPLEANAQNGQITPTVTVDYIG
jgi:predicted ribosomally synthesized peptide with SipW-like signal peptide